MIRHSFFTAYLVACLSAGVFGSSAFGEAYLLSSNAADAESRIVIDLQKRALDPTNLAPDASGKALAAVQKAPPFAQAVLQSALKKICPVLSVDNDYGRQYAFRSIHALGKIDWIVTASLTAPESIGSITFLLDMGKPPAVLPIIPSVGESAIMPSVETGCSSEEERKAAEKEIYDACKQLGETCKLK